MNIIQLNVKVLVLICTLVSIIGGYCAAAAYSPIVGMEPMLRGTGEQVKQPAPEPASIVTPKAPPTLLNNLTVVARRSYFSTSVAVSGNLAVIDAISFEGSIPKQGLVFLDISDPANPTELSFFPLATWWGPDILIAGDFLFVDNHGTLTILDISDPAAPVLHGTFTMTGSTAFWGMGIKGTYLYTTGYFQTAEGVHLGNQFLTIDVSDPANPALAGSWAYSDSGYSTHQDMVFNGNFGYSNFSTGLAVFDFADPVHPALSNRYYNGQIYQIDISGDLLCVGTDRGVEVLSLADPGAPALLGYDFFPFLRDGKGASPAIDGDKLYLGWNERSFLGISVAGLMVYSISDPASPQLLAHYEKQDSEVFDVEVAKGCAFLAGDTFLVLQYTPGTGEGEGEPLEEGEVEGEGEGEGEEEYFIKPSMLGEPIARALLASLGMEPGSTITRSDLETITQIDPLADEPVLQSISAVRYCVNLEVLDATDQKVDDLSYLARLPKLREVYLANNEVKTLRGLVDNPAFGPGCILDIRNNPLTNESLCEFVPALRHRGVTVMCDKLCGQGIEAWPPNQRFEVQGRYYADMNIQHVVVQDATAYVGGYSPDLVKKGGGALYGLDIVDVSDPYHPVALSRSVIPGVNDLCIAGEYLYIARTGGFDTVDISDPYHPQFVHHPLPLRAGLHTTDLTTAGDTLWVTSSDSLFSVDITDPPQARYLGPWAFVSPGTAKWNNYLYALSVSSLSILDTTILEYPVFLGSAAYGSGGTNLGGNKDMALYGEYAITLRGSNVFMGGGAFEIFDVSDPTAPLFIDGWEIPGGDPTSMTLLGDIIFLANDIAGVNAVDISNFQEWTWRGTYYGEPMPEHVRGTQAVKVAAVPGGTCYIAEHNFMTIVQHLWPENPDEGEGEGPLPVPHDADSNEDFRIELSEAINYLAGWQQGGNPMAYAIRAAYIWQKGELYRYDAEQAPPMCWVLAPPVEGEG